MKKIFLVFLILFQSQLALTQVSCRVAASPQAKLQINYNEKEVLHFLRTHQIVPERILTPILDRVSAFRFQNEDMGNAILISTLSALGPQPSRQRDLLVQEYLSPLFNHYLSDFQKFTSQLPKGWNLRVHNLFELSKLGYKADSYGTIHWSTQDSVRFLDLMKIEFSKKTGFDLVAANRLLVQMAFLQSSLSGSKKWLLSDLKTASDNYFLAEERPDIIASILLAPESFDQLIQNYQIKK